MTNHAAIPASDRLSEQPDDLIVLPGGAPVGTAPDTDQFLDGAFDLGALITDLPELGPLATRFAELATQGFALMPLALFVGGAAAAFAGARLLVIVAAAGLGYLLAVQHGLLLTPLPWALPLFVVMAALGLAHGILSLTLGADGGTQAFLLLVGGMIVFALLRPLRLLRALVPGGRTPFGDRRGK